MYFSASRSKAVSKLLRNIVVSGAFGAMVWGAVGSLSLRRSFLRSVVPGMPMFPALFVYVSTLRAAPVNLGVSDGDLW